MSSSTTRRARVVSTRSAAARVIETLESRRVLAAVSWDGGGDGVNWTDVNNWSTNTLPQPADDVTINVAANPTIALNGANAVINSLTSAEALNLNSGTLSVAVASTASAGVTLSGAMLGGSGNVTITSVLTWTGGEMSGTGTTTLAAGASAAISANYNTFLNRRLDLAGTTTVSGTGIWYQNGGAVLNNLAGATLTLSGEADLTKNGGGSQAFNNAGTIVKNTAGDTNIGVAFNNSGTLNLTAGTLTLSGGTNLGSGVFLSAGRYLVTAGTTLNFGGSPTVNAAELDITGTVTGLGTLSVNRGRIGLNAGADFATTPAGGTFTNEGILDLSPGSVFAVTGNMRFAGASQPIIRAELASASNFGRLTISGSLNLESPGSTSRFDPDLVGGYNPAPGTRHDLIVAGGGILSGFDSFFGGPTPGGNTLLATRPTPNIVAVDVGTGAPPPAPQLLSQAFEYQTREAVLFGFNQDVSAFLSRKDYSITNRTTGVTLPQSAGTLSYNPTSNQAILTLTNQLPDGNYRLTIQAGDIANPAGVPLTGGLSFDFFVLHGDADHDRDVDFDDLLALARSYGEAGKTFSQGNYNYSADGSVDFDDLLALAKNYGKTLAVAPAMATVAGSTRSRTGGAIAAQVLA